jgi:hypothetical protein
MHEQQSTGQADSSGMHGIVVFPHRAATLLFFGTWLVFLTGIGLAVLSTSQGRGSPPPLLWLAFFALVGWPLGLYQLYLALRPQPYLLINEDGIRFSAPLLNGDVIPWRAIAALRLVTTRRRNHILYLVPRTPTTILSRQPLGLWLLYMQPPGWGTGEVRLSALFPAKPPHELVQQIVQRYGHALQAYQVAV